ncbi:hypothetical protein ACFE04_019011 [Oxalis oulophora]
MRLSNTPFDHFTVPIVVSACAEVKSLNYGKCVHGLVSKFGLFDETGSCFVYFYGKCGVLEDAYNVFDELTVRDVVSWTALVAGFVKNGESEKGLEFIYEMHRVGEEHEKPNSRTIESGLEGCRNLGALVDGRGLHALVVKSGLSYQSRIRSSLLSMYAKCGDPREAYLSFSEVLDKDLFSWTEIIGAYARYGLMKDCLKMFREMQVDEIYPDDVIVSCILSGFANFLNAREGKAFHGFITRRKYIFTKIVYNTLLSMYCKFGLLILAENVFNSVDQKDNEFSNMMVSGYGQMGLERKCIKLFREMQHLGTEFDPISLVSVILSCSKLQETCLGESLHCYIIKNGLVRNIGVVNSLIDMYGRNGNLTAAWRIFCITERDTILWNTLMSAYCHSGRFAEAIALFNQMISENMKPDLATLKIVVSACSHLANIAKGESIYNYIKEEGFELNLSLTTALIDMYAKCGQLEKSRDLFNSMKEHDAISWNVMISGYGMHGDAKLALQIFEEMEKSKVKPNELTFLHLLSACAHAGLVKEGKYLFDKMQNYSVIPSLKHYACMVDLLGRSGDLQEAEALVMSMPIPPDGGVWGALLSACKIHDDTEMGIRVAKHAIDSDPENDGYYIILSNLYSSAGLWGEAERARLMIKERRVEKIAGWSTV